MLFAITIPSTVSSQGEFLAHKSTELNGERHKFC